MQWIFGDVDGDLVGNSVGKKQNSPWKMGLAALPQATQLVR